MTTPLTAPPTLIRRNRGRPPKYGRSASAVTITLPHDILAGLQLRDADLGRAIVSLVEGAHRVPRQPPPPAEIVAYGRHAVILVTPVAPLRRMRGVELIPVDRHRALISLGAPQTVPRLELEIRDVLESGRLSERERLALEGVATILRKARASETYSLTERTVIVLEDRRRRQPSGLPRR